MVKVSTTDTIGLLLTMSKLNA